MGLPPDITTPRDHRHGSRLGDIIRRLGSDREGERAAAVCAMLRLLASVGADLHDVANHIEQPSGLTKAEMQKSYDAGHDAGYAEGRRAAEQELGDRMFRSVNLDETKSRASVRPTPINCATSVKNSLFAT